jgi:hypothetical protein
MIQRETTQHENLRLTTQVPFQPQLAQIQKALHNSREDLNASNYLLST